MVGLAEEWPVPCPMVAPGHQNDELDNKLLAIGCQFSFF